MISRFGQIKPEYAQQGRRPKGMARIFLGSATFALAFFPSAARSDLRPDRFHVTQARKTNDYIRDGVFSGGERSVEDVEVRDIRHAGNRGFERIVVDLGENREGAAAPLVRAPYYQVAVNPDEKRLVISIWGRPRPIFNVRRVKASFRKSRWVRRLVLLPPVDPDVWTFVAEMRANRPVEVFELSHPARIIVDIRATR